MRETIDRIYRADSRRILATLIRLLGDFDLAEEAMQDAFAAAVERWPTEGIPSSPRTWLISAGRFRAIDKMRRVARFRAAQGMLVAEHEALAATSQEASAALGDDEGIADDRLRLIFVCCHPVLSPDAQVALTLREVCGLTTEEIARAFLVTPTTIAQRIVRAKARIRAAQIPYEIPSHAELPARLDRVLSVIYLVFNEGYTASSGEQLVRASLAADAIALGRLVLTLLPDPEVHGLLALMLLQMSRVASRVSDSGELVLLADQDRSRWDTVMISEGQALVASAWASRRVGPFTLQAAIASLHAEAREASATDWPQIVALYDVLLRADPSPVVALNRAVAVAMRDGPAAGIALIDALLAAGALHTYAYAHSARAALCLRAGVWEAAREGYSRALALTTQHTERRFLEAQLAQLSARR